jgi:hypothetical protein
MAAKTELFAPNIVDCRLNTGSIRPPRASFCTKSSHFPAHVQFPDRSIIKRGLCMKLSEFSKIIDDYFEKCEAAGVFPDESGLVLALGMTRRVYDSYFKRKDRAGLPFRDKLETARMKRDSILDRRLFADGKGRMFSTRGTGDDSKNTKTEIEITIRGETEYFQ